MKRKNDTESESIILKKTMSDLNVPLPGDVTDLSVSPTVDLIDSSPKRQIEELVNSFLPTTDFCSNTFEQTGSNAA